MLSFFATLTTCTCRFILLCSRLTGPLRFDIWSLLLMLLLVMVG
uniref:Uncharacterized protein n=1 Tax=Anguilla anguilla TaxID=7936 RepID=A0A0E9VWR9_ANGAN